MTYNSLRLIVLEEKGYNKPIAKLYLDRSYIRDKL